MSIDRSITSGSAGHRRSRARTIVIAALAAIPLVATLGLAAPTAEPAAAAEPAHISGTIAGVQLDADTGLSGAYVAAYRSDDPAKVVTAERLTNVTGKFTLELPAGSYRVKAVTEARATEWWDGATSFATAGTIAAAAGETKSISFNLDIPATAFTLDPDDSPSVVGVGEVGLPVTAVTGAWSPAPTSFSYQWLRGGVPIAGATSASYTVDQSPQNLVVAIIPRRAGYSEWPFFAWYLVTEPIEGLAEVFAAMDPDTETHADTRLNGFTPFQFAVPESIAVGTRPIRGFPTAGDSYAVLSTGNAAEALVPGNASVELDTYLQTPNGELFWITDESRVRLSVKPPPGTACLALDVMFGSEEFGGPALGDYFSVESPVADTTEDDEPPENNFARDTDGSEIAVGAQVGLSPEPGWTLDGFTPALSVHVPLGGVSQAGPGYTDVIPSVLDIADSYRDSVLFVDNLRFLPAGECRTDGIARPIVDVPPVVEGTKPVVKGTAAVGKKLTVVAGAWSPDGVKLTYQWLRNGNAIPGATNSSYTLRVQDLLSRISVRVKGSAPGVDPLTLVSAQTGRVRVR